MAEAEDAVEEPVELPLPLVAAAAAPPEVEEPVAEAVEEADEEEEELLLTWASEAFFAPQTTD